MKLEYIVTLANERVRLRFLALERSLRATGCDLPLRVIPYDDNRFELPPGAEWWEDRKLFDFLRAENAHSTMRKYLCFFGANFQFVDSDIVFLRNPADVLASHEGWILSCAAWRSPRHTMTPELAAVLAQKTELAQLRLFNSGQFACDRSLYDFFSLREAMLDPRYAPTALRQPYHEQPGVNLLTQLSGVPVTNITLPPHPMESTWAGDYWHDDYDRNWSSDTVKPYLIHWAGLNHRTQCRIDELYLQYFTAAERREWDEQIAQRRQAASQLSARLRGWWWRGRKATAEALSVLRTGKTRAELSAAE